MRFPKEVDHIDGKRNNNREKNLRSVTRRKNLQNRYEHRNGKLVGATFDKHANKWKAALWINGKNKHIKNCDTELEAHLAYKKYLEVNEMVKLWISVQMDATMKHDLDDHCKDNNISRSDLIRDFIENLLYTKET
jgi:metal-responsive CopG/Arc/MetJ family transcriptional regulator